ncbi:hypothetical protein MUK42_16038 [Musa troglodytarum]|uniref:Uncharacterized protein n=1 Tax=Musa troglodytarum TaxID=320322 RepID=A0A9E7KZQ3_9LILI|nr:hypothetical protein MUK42_16038 [Musa troglodytarum]
MVKPSSRAHRVAGDSSRPTSSFDQGPEWRGEPGCQHTGHLPVAARSSSWICSLHCLGERGRAKRGAAARAGLWIGTGRPAIPLGSREAGRHGSVAGRVQGATQGARCRRLWVDSSAPGSGARIRGRIPDALRLGISHRRPRLRPPARPPTHCL